MLFWVFFPSMFFEEIHQPGLLIGLAILFGIPLSLFEYLYHRYFLHHAVLPFLSKMHKAHNEHHGLTSVKAPVNPKQEDLKVHVVNNYAIESIPQKESMMFPGYGISIFQCIFILTIGLPLKLIWPHLPVILATITSVTVMYVAYEVWHAILHFPYTKYWKPLLEGNKWYSSSIRRSYGFHLIHHFRPKTNLAIVGLWGFPLWDYLGRTRIGPKVLPLPGSKICYIDGIVPRPSWPIRVMDAWQTPMYKWSRRVDDWTIRQLRRTVHS